MGILSDIVNEDKVEMCPDACCGKPITECKCGPDCEHCDCHSKNKAMNEGTMIGGLMKYDGQPEGEYADAVAKYKEFMSKPRPPGEATTTMVQGFVFDDELLDNLGDAEEDGDILDVRFIVQSRLEDFFGDDFELAEGTQGCADCEWISDETDGDITTCDDCAAEKREKTNEAEKRWKQTSMSPQEAIEKYGKENVKVKKGALRNGDDMVEVFVESMNEGGNDVADAKKNALELLVDIAKTSKQYKGEVTKDQIHYLGSLINDFDALYGIEEEKYSEIEKLFRSMASTKKADMTMIQPAYAQAKTLEAETESYSPGDEMEDGVVSNCCGAPLMDYNDGHGRCSDCKEMAAGETDEEYYESDISRLKELSGITEAPTTATLNLGKRDPQNMNPGDITDPEAALIHTGKTRGVDDPFDASGTGHADGIGWSQSELDAASAGFKDVLDTANQIKINRYLAKLPLDIAKGIADKNNYGTYTNPETGKRENPGNSFSTGYDHVGNPNYGADAMDPETIAKIKDPNWRDTFNMQDPKFKNIRPTEATNEEIEAEIKRLQDLIKY